MFSLQGTTYPSFYLHGFLSQEKIQEYTQLVELASRQGSLPKIVQEAIQEEIWRRIIPMLSFESISPPVRVGNSVLQGIENVHLHKRNFPAGIHQDLHKTSQTLYTGVILLKDGSGMSFYDSQIKRTAQIDSSPGTLILFDSREFHSGRTFPRSFPEYSLSFRFVYKEILSL